VTVSSVDATNATKELQRQVENVTHRICKKIEEALSRDTGKRNISSRAVQSGASLMEYVAIVD
jgi:hypothetical protein